MQITLANGSSHTINEASDIADLEIEGQKITNYSPEEGENNIEFTNTDHLAAYLEKKDDGRTDEDALLAWLNNVQPRDRDEDYIKKFDDAYMGEYTSTNDFAKEQGNEMYADSLEDMPHALKDAIDWEVVWNSTLRFDYWESNGYFFNSNS